MKRKVIYIIITVLLFFVLATAALILLLDTTSKGTLIITVSPDKDAIININDANYASGAQISLKAGKYTALITKTGYDNYVQPDIDITKGKTTKIDVQLTKTVSQEEKNFQKMLPFVHDNGNFTIDVEKKDDNTFTYLVDLNIREDLINDETKPIIAGYKKEALKWILSQSIDPETITIEWVPSTAVNL